MNWERQRDWNKLERRSQNENAKHTLKACCKMLGLQEDVELIDVKENDRFVLFYEQSGTHPDFGMNMIRLETLMRKFLGVVVDLRLEVEPDKNKREQRNTLGGRK